MENRTVLVIEDDVKNTKLMRVLLEREHYRVISATEAKTGMQLAREHRPFVILMDIQLPGLDGISATRMIKEDPIIGGIPIVGVSSYAMEEDIEKAKEAGCNGYLTKPIDVHTFMDRIRQFVKNTETKEASASRARAYAEKRILIVDDNPLNVKLFASKLSREGCSTIAAYNGEEALKMVIEEYPDLILLDLMMPVMDGFEVLEKLKADPRTRDIHVIVITALNEEERLNKIVDIADEILSKPVNTVELVTRVKSMLFLQELQVHLRLEDRSTHYAVVPKGEERSARDTGHVPHVLLVEDEEKDAKLMQQYLSGALFKLSLARSGREAFSFLRRERVDLILLDILLPDMDGLEICQQLKLSKETKDIQIIAVTNIRDLDKKKKSFEVGIDEYLVKPVNKQELRIRIKTLLERKSNLDKLRATLASNAETLV
jgi:two-component system cell cycle response regulator